MTVFYFTATGNSLEVARAFDATLLSIATELYNGKQVRYKDDIIGIVCPIYFSDVPKLIVKFLRNKILEAEYKFLILTYGEARGIAPQMLYKRCGELDVTFDYVNCIKMVDNYYPLYDVKTQVENLYKKCVDSKLCAIKADIKAKVKRVDQPNWVDRIIGLSRYLKPKYGRHAQCYYVDVEKCNSCGICVKVCPEKNIRLKSGKTPDFSIRCEGCGACTHNCPQNAIRYKGEKSKNRYRNAKITLQDIIDANNA